jgi:cardiolipin synthase
MLEAIARARETINMEVYIFKKGVIGDQFIEALCERAKAGVRVTLVMDTIGSFGAFHQAAKPLRAAGCRVELYHRLRWYTLSRLNNRTHRELLVVDGRVAFAGGPASPTGGSPAATARAGRASGATRWHASKDRSFPRSRA